MVQPAHKRLVTEEKLNISLENRVTDDGLTTALMNRVTDSELDTAVKSVGHEQADSEVMYVGGVIAGISGTPVIIDGAYVIAPPSSRPQSIRFEATWNITVQGGGFFTLQLYEYTAGSAALKAYKNSAWISPSRPLVAAGDREVGHYRVDPHTDWKVFQVYFTLTRDAGSSLQMGVPMLGTEYTKELCELVQR